MSTSLYWLRQDLRLEDNPALLEALKHSNMLPVFIFDTEKEWLEGSASQWWLHESLAALQRCFQELGSDLLFFSGDKAWTVLDRLCQEHNVEAVYWNRVYEPEHIVRDTKIKAQLKQRGILCESFATHILSEGLVKKDGTPYLVYTPFWKVFSQSYKHTSPLEAPKNLAPLPKGVKATKLDDLRLLPKINWYKGFNLHPQNLRLESFLNDKITCYKSLRDMAALDQTSMLSPYLRFGQISPRQVWDQAVSMYGSPTHEKQSEEVRHFFKELCWREFSYHLLFHFPHTTTQALQGRFNQFPWLTRKDYLEQWQKGLTGYPIVDAGMRQLWQTGWMHNRVRMIVASFLIKHLNCHWLDGAKWFWDTLLDADLANNTQGWQWTAGCGADASPYFRIFNPVLQGEKFDPKGDYVMRYVPELRDFDRAFIHKPWEAANAPLHYPGPMVEHKQAREAALAQYKRFKASAS
jgi:deoxyribodipyrimidine photo-lyase